MIYTVSAFFLIIFVFGLQYYASKTRVVPVPTWPHVRRAAIKLIKDQECKPVHIVELGAGWGGMTHRLARAYPDARMDAYEISVFPYLVSWLRAWRSKNIFVMRQDVFEVDLSEVDLVFCYLSPWHMERLVSKFDRELKPGAIVISASFPLSERESTAQTHVTHPVKIPIYLYRW